MFWTALIAVATVGILLFTGIELMWKVRDRRRRRLAERKRELRQFIQRELDTRVPRSDE